MKKVLSTVAALGLVAGLASTASAVEFKMSGKYLVEGTYLNSIAPVAGAGTANYVNGGVQPNVATGNEAVSDAYFMHTFEIKPTMKVNDKVSMASVIRLADRTFWGAQEDAQGNKMSENGTSNLYVHQLYMDYASPIGTFRIGRTPAGTYGTSFMDFDQRGDRIMLWPVGLEKPWSTLFYIQKNHNDNRDIATGALPGNLSSNVDSTSYVARVYYNTDTVDTGLHYQYTNNATNGTLYPDGTWAAATSAPLNDAKQQLTAYGKFKLDNYFVNGELTHFFGSKDYVAAGTLDRDYDSWAGMLQVGGKFDALTPSLMYFYAQGQDKTATAANGGDIENALGTTGTGDMFEPLYILTGRHTGMLNNDIYNAQTGTMSTAGVHAIVAAADYAVSNQLTLHGAIGWAKADEAETATRPNRDDAYGWEYNVGAAYKLLDNLTYEAHFGYLDTGDFFNSSAAGVESNTGAKNIYLLTHSLTMTF
jgi:hypothetical protein